MLTDKAFDLPSPPAIAARESTKCVLTWSADNKDNFSTFALELEETLSPCFSTTCKKVTTTREKMWEKYYKIRSTDEFKAKWKRFLHLSGAVASPTLYQHITDLVFNHLIKKHFTTSHTQPTQSDSIPPLDYNERNAIRYISGYLTRSVYHKLNKSKHKYKDELCLCLCEINDVEPEEMNESSEWTKEIDRGGLKHVTNMTYMMFVSAEEEIRKHLTTFETTNEVKFAAAKDKIIDSDDVQFYWCMVTSDWETEVASTFLDMLIDDFVKLRGHSTASAWLEQYKRESKKSFQKSKGVRKQLLSKTSTSLTPSNKESVDTED